MRLSDIVRGTKPAQPARQPEAPATTATDLIRRAARSETPVGAPPPVREAPPASPPRRVVDSPPAETSESAGHRADASELVMSRAIERIRDSLAVRGEAPFSIGQAEEAVEILLQSVEASDALLTAFFRTTEADQNQARKAVNVAILSLKLGLELGYGREQLRELGLAGLLCDIGTTLVPAPVLAGSEPLTGSERATLRAHQLEGAALLERLAPEYGWLGEVIRRRYETEDSTYQTESRREEYAAIVHLADTYRSLVHPRASRRRVGPLDALKEILQRQRARFPDRILKALIRAMSTFPVGSLIRLNTGEIGRVVASNRSFPLRPVVEVFVRRGKRLTEPARIDLAQSPLLYIKESVVEEDLQ